MMLPPRLIAHLTRPLKLLNARVDWIERWLQIPLSKEDAAHVREACGKSHGVRLGEYYHWYLQKLLVAKVVRNINKKRALALVNSTDHSDYAPLRQVTESGTGVLIAIPHHAHYIFTMIAVAEKLRETRQIYIFYGRPGTHKGNEVFDHLCKVIWGDSSNVEFVHDTRQGMAKAIKGLKNGDVVMIMPDVFQNEDATLAIPFCDRPMNVMVGTATLARKTGSWILPVMSIREGRGLGFRTFFGDRIDNNPNEEMALTAEVARVIDYAVTRQLFGQFEEVMATDILYWQNMRQHLAQDRSLQFLERDALPELAKLLETDPSLQPPSVVVDLRTVAA